LKPAESQYALGLEDLNGRDIRYVGINYRTAAVLWDKKKLRTLGELINYRLNLGPTQFHREMLDTPGMGTKSVRELEAFLSGKIPTHRTAHVEKGEPLNRSGLSTRAVNALKWESITTVEALLFERRSRTAADFHDWMKRMNNVGGATITEVEQYVAAQELERCKQILMGF
jgi:hypothetical protein